MGSFLSRDSDCIWMRNVEIYVSSGGFMLLVTYVQLWKVNKKNDDEKKNEKKKNYFSCA